MQNALVRAFIAVDIPMSIKERVIAAEKELGTDGFRLVGADQMHVTLAFLGNISEKQVESAKMVVSGVTHSKFNISFVGAGTFDVKRPRVVFAEITKGADGLIELYGIMREGLSKITRLEERWFSPHVTIARLKRFDRTTAAQAVDFINKYKDYDFGSFECDAVRLKSSVLSQAAPVHADLLVKELH